MDMKSTIDGFKSQKMNAAPRAISNPLSIKKQDNLAYKLD